LPTDEQTLVHVLDLKTTGEETNSLVTEMAPLLRDLHKVCVRGETIDGSRGHAANVQVIYAKAALKTRGEAARDEAKYDKMAKMKEHVEKVEALQARKAKAAPKAKTAPKAKKAAKPKAAPKPKAKSKKATAHTAAVFKNAILSVRKRNAVDID